MVKLFKKSLTVYNGWREWFEKSLKLSKTSYDVTWKTMLSEIKGIYIEKDQ